MYIAPDLASIARDNGLSGFAGVGKPVGTLLTKAQLKSFTTLKAEDGVYYNEALNVLSITKSGVTLNGYDFRGVSINVQADNVTIKNSTFDAATGSYAINAVPGTKNLTVDHSTFDGLKLDKIGYADFVISRGQNTTLTHNAFLDAPNDAVSIQSGTISGNYFAGGAYATGAHADAIWIGKTLGPIVISDNTIDWRARADAPTETNEAVRITGELGNVANVLVKHNILLGGSMTVLVSDGATQTHTAGQVGSVTGVQVVENVIDYGKYGDLEQTSRPKDMVYADNMHASGRPVAPGQEAVGALPDLSTLNKITAASAKAVIKGTDKGDYILGGSGSNHIVSGAGDDVIVGGGGRDYITGGAGKDTFLYHSLTGSGTDLISGFEVGVDRIDFSDLGGNDHALSDWQWLGAESFTGHDWQLRYETGGGTTSVQVDVDGDLKADFQLNLSGTFALNTRDFILAEHRPSLPTVPQPSVPTLPPVSSEPIEAPQPVPTKPPAPATPADPTDPDLVLQAPVSGGYVTGTTAAERIVGSSKGDGLRGGGGDDVLVGGGGKDLIYGGAGHDTFQFQRLSDSTASAKGRDYIGDFKHGEDVIDLHLIDANILTAAHEAFSWIGEGAFTEHAGELRFSSKGNGVQVQADVNGDGKADFAIDLIVKTALSISDFVL